MKASEKTAGKKAPGRIGTDDAAVMVRLFRVLTEEQFDFWIDSLNRAVIATGGDGDVFSRDDRQKTISYWYLLMFLLEVYAKKSNPFAVKKSAGFSDGLVSMKQLGEEMGDRYKEETVRRYVFDLKRHGLIALEGRGGEGMVRLSAPAILALVDTIRHWVGAFRDLDRRYVKMAGLSIEAPVQGASS